MSIEAAESIEVVQPSSAARQEWWDHANCNTGTSTLTGLFFSDELQDIARAKSICATCPVLEPCLAAAIERREQVGVWGGQLFRNGRVLTSKRQRGRPPRVSRPEDLFLEVPVPASLQELVRQNRQSVA